MWSMMPCLLEFLSIALGSFPRGPNLVLTQNINCLYPAFYLPNCGQNSEILVMINVYYFYIDFDPETFLIENISRRKWMSAQDKHWASFIVNMRGRGYSKWMYAQNKHWASVIVNMRGRGYSKCFQPLTHNNLQITWHAPLWSSIYRCL